MEFKECISEKVPLEADHVAELAPPPIVPFNVMEPEVQTVCGDPALTTAGGFTSILMQLLVS